MLYCIFIVAGIYYFYHYEVVYETIGNPAFCLALYLTGVHFRGTLQLVGHVGGQKIKYRPIRTRKIGSVRLQEELYVLVFLNKIRETIIDTSESKFENLSCFLEHYSSST